MTVLGRKKQSGGLQSQSQTQGQPQSKRQRRKSAGKLLPSNRKKRGGSPFHWKRRRELIDVKIPVEIIETTNGNNKKDKSDAKHNSSTKNSNSKQESESNKIKLDVATTEIIKTEVEDLLADRNGSCSMLELATALAASRRIKDAHAANSNSNNNSNYTFAPSSESTLTRLTRKVVQSVGWKSINRKPANTPMHRRYDMTIAFKSLEQHLGATTIQVKSWKKAKGLFKSAFEFPTGWALELLNQVTSTNVESTRKAFGCDDLGRTDDFSEVLSSEQKYREIKARSVPKLLSESKKDLLRNHLDSLSAKQKEARKSKTVEDLEKKRLDKEKAAEAKKLASSLLRDFTDQENTMVEEAIWGRGASNQVLQTEGTDTVQRESMRKLQPGQWLNDEIIHFFYVMLGKRDEGMCKADPSNNRKRSHFFKSFFITTLLNEGHSDPDIDGTFEYRRVKRWSKKVPGKDIFKLDKIFFPINQGGMHWVCAVASMQEKKIQFYDSMGAPGTQYLKHLMRYIEEEHQDKKKAPLPDKDQWQLIPCTPETPRQGNGYDCGVFTCMFADFLSKDCPLMFTQHHVDQCRERIALSICLGKAIV